MLNATVTEVNQWPKERGKLNPERLLVARGAGGDLNKVKQTIDNKRQT